MMVVLCYPPTLHNCLRLLFDVLCSLEEAFLLIFIEMFPTYVLAFHVTGFPDTL